MTTIKEHLDAIREALEFAHILEAERNSAYATPVSDKAQESCDAIQSLLDKPMKSAEEWRTEWPLPKSLMPKDEVNAVSFIRSIQQDARLSQDQRIEAAEKMREALEFYADYKKNWETHHYAEASLVSLDLGGKARQALSAYDAACGKGNDDE